LDKASASGNPPNLAPRSLDDIPIAVRETPIAAPKTKVNKSALMLIVATLGIVGMSTGALVAVQMQRSPQSPAAPARSPVAVSPSPSASPVDADTMLGHYRYAEAPANELVPLTSDGSLKLRRAAAKAYQEMESAAQRDGVSLVPLSAFRSIQDQNYLFFGKKAERGQVAEERAKVSAPPGFSEHHTGYVLDIGDGRVPATDLSPNFENTPAYKWLKANAAFYSFELSFPKGNKQGVTYEPWHWRFVGDSQSLETFAKAKNAVR
jgi:zinc D-Ala-D-Ala carboxypeptidase